MTISSKDMADLVKGKKLRIIVVGAAWYGDWAKNF